MKKAKEIRFERKRFNLSKKNNGFAFSIGFAFFSLGEGKDMYTKG